MTERSQQVRDLTTAPRRLPIEVEGSVAFEVVLTMWSVFNPKESNTAFDLGKKWQGEVKAHTAPDLAEEIVTLGGPYCFLWLAISSLLISAPHPHDPDNVFEWLANIDESRLRRWLVGYASHDGDQALIEEAATGDLEAVEELVGEKAEEKPEFVDHIRWIVEAQELPRRFADALIRFRQEVFAEYEEEFGAAIARAAAARKAMATRADAKSVIEEVTSGIEFDIPLGISRVVLIPSVVCRPLSLIDAHRGTLLVYYGAADEFVNNDPEAPPSWLLRTYKALSDERRLRILRRLSEGDTSLDELTELLDLSKSTVHHHISILRAAGLVRVHLPSDGEDGDKRKHYTLREQSLADATGLLDSYLRTEQQGAKHG